jgi:hypothetical protein
MAIQVINVGNIVNDGLGDDLRTAFLKVNANFEELSGTSNTTAANVGTAGVGVFKQKQGTELQFKNIIAGRKMFLTGNENNIIVNTDQPDAFTRIITEEGVILAEEGTTVTFQGGANTTVTANGSVITIQETINSIDLVSTIDFGTVTGKYENAIQFILAAGDYDFGTFDNASIFDYDAGTINGD